MLSNPRVQSVLFFFAVAFVYGVAYQGGFYFYAETPSLSGGQAYPIFALDNLHTPTRLLEHFLSGAWLSFYQNYIYGIFLQPIGGEAHFVDVFLQAALVAYALTYAAFCFVSLCFVRLFVQLKWWHSLVYALLFYLFFVQYEDFRNHYVRLLSYHSGYALAMIFLYPIAAYVLTARDVFSKWQPHHATALMAALCYFSYSSILFVSVFTSIALFCLWLVRLLENRSASPSAAWAKLKTEPMWLLVSTAFSFLLTLVILILSYGGSRRAEILTTTDKLDSFTTRLADWFATANHYDGTQFIFLALVGFLCLVFYRKLKMGFRPWVLFLGAVLFLSFGALLTLYLGDRLYLLFTFTPLLFIFTTLLLGFSFWLLEQKAVMPVLAFAMMIFSLGAVRQLNFFIPDRKANSNLINYDMKQAINLGYTFGCYGQARVPVARAYLASTDWVLLPSAGGAAWRKWEWNTIMRRQTGGGAGFKFFADTRDEVQYRSNFPVLTYYHEPSVDKINAQLANLARNGEWRCANVPNDIYRLRRVQ